MFNFIPKGFNLPEDMDAIKEYKRKYPGVTFIAKPAVGGQKNEGIFLFKELKDLHDRPS